MTALTVTPLPEPTSLQSRGEAAYRRTANDFPEDVAREISKHLSDTERLGLSTASKFFHAACPPRPTDARCTTLQKATALREHITQSTGGARHLVALDFRCMGSVTQIQPAFCGLLTQAWNLRRLTCGTLEMESAEARRLIQALSHLSYLQLHQPSSGAFNDMAYPQSLRSLHLFKVEGGSTWTDLAKKLSGLTRLTELTLANSAFEDTEVADDEDDASASSTGYEGPPPLPSINTLKAISTDLPSSVSRFSNMFPSLETLALQDSEFPSEYGDDPEAEDRDIHRLECLMPEEVDSPICWRVHHLAVLSFDAERLDPVVICSTDDLVGLAVRVPHFTFETWVERVEPCISGVRLLELDNFDLDCSQTIDFFANVFEKRGSELYGDLPLVVLSIAASGAAPKDAAQSHARLFKPVADSFPRLQYLALAGVERFPQDFTDLSGERAPWRWWRIVREADAVEFREIPAWEGERVRKYFRDADREKADSFDGKPRTSVPSE